MAPCRTGSPFLKGDKILFAKERDKACDGLHVVDHTDGPHFQDIPQAGLVDHPGEICDLRLSLEYRSGNTEDGLRCTTSCLFQEKSDGFLEASKPDAGIHGLDQGPAQTPLLREEPEVEFGSSDVAG